MSDILRLNSKIKNKSIRISDYDNNNETASAYVDQEEIIRTNYQNYYDQGYGDGRKSLKLEFEHEYKNLLLNKFSDIAELVKKLEKAIDTYDKSFDKLVIDTAFLIAEKILHKEIEKESPIRFNMKAALQRVIGANNITIKLYNDDYKLIVENQKELFGDVSLSHIKFEPDESIESGGCFIETEIGNVDGRITTQLNELKNTLESAVNGL